MAKKTKQNRAVKRRGFLCYRGNTNNRFCNTPAFEYFFRTHVQINLIGSFYNKTNLIGLFIFTFDWQVDFLKRKHKNNKNKKYRLLFFKMENKTYTDRLKLLSEEDLLALGDLLAFVCLHVRHCWISF